MPSWCHYGLPCALVVPQACQKKVLELLHLPHLGVVRSKAAARCRYYWPSMNNQVEQLVASCEECAYFEPSKPQEPQIRPKVKEETLRAFERVGVDVFHVGSKKYLALVDYYSSYILVKELKRTTNEKIMETLDGWFSVRSRVRNSAVRTAGSFETPLTASLQTGAGT